MNNNLLSCKGLKASDGVFLIKIFSLSGHLLSSEHSTSHLYQTSTPPTGATSSWNPGGKSRLVSGPMADLWPWPCVQNPNIKNQSLPPSKTSGLCECDCWTCEHVIVSICLMDHLKISDPLRTLCLLLEVCVKRNCLYISVCQHFICCLCVLV